MMTTDAVPSEKRRRSTDTGKRSRTRGLRVYLLRMLGF
jgi:hypothetical protein